MRKLRKNEGFTLAELLIVVAIIAILVAISIPIFTSQLKKSRLATNQANGRAAYAATVAEMLDEEMTSATATYTVKTAKISITSGATTTGGTSAAPAGWHYSKSSGGWKEPQLGEKTASAWKVSVDSDGNVRYIPTWE